MQISKRLKSLAYLVESDDVIADIGCDHALLDIYLIKNNIVSKCLISDINESALKSGIDNIKKYHLEKYIDVKLGDGIETITNDINTLIISGMGSSSICKILDNPKIKQINKLIIESNNDYYLLRSYICSKGFYISYEEVIYDKGKYYVNIVFLKGYREYSKIELKYGPILIKNSNKEYFNYLYKLNNNILNNIPKYKLFLRIKINKDNFILKILKRK